MAVVGDNIKGNILNSFSFNMGAEPCTTHDDFWIYLVSVMVVFYGFQVKKNYYSKFIGFKELFSIPEGTVVYRCLKLRGYTIPYWYCFFFFSWWYVCYFVEIITLNLKFNRNDFRPHYSYSYGLNDIVLYSLSGMVVW